MSASDASQPSTATARDDSAVAAGARHHSVTYRPEIDGLRAVAVLPVILFHMGYGWMAGGYIGVDVFFVISGFLITSIVLADLARGTFSFREFWARRVRRILPAMLVVTTSTLLVTVALVFRPDRPEIGRQAVASLLSVANLYFWRTTGDYWGKAAEQSPFLHMWSLAVEEQFYLLLPIGVWLVARTARADRLLAALLTAAIASLCAFLYGLREMPTFTFYTLPTRAWELAAGCILACLLHPAASAPRLPGAPALGTAGLALIVVAMLLLPVLGAGLVVAILGATLVLAFAHAGLAHRLLASAPAVHIGRLSYSLYLWHWPLLVFAQYLRWSGSKAWLLLPMYVLARLSHAFVEEPARKHRRAVMPILAAQGLVLAGAVALAVAPAAYDTSAYATPQWHGTAYDLKPRGESSEDFARIMAHVAAAPRRAGADTFRTGGLRSGPAHAAPRIVVLGDSHGTMWSETIRRASEDLGVPAAFLSINGLSPFPTVPATRQAATRYLTSQERYAYDASRLAYIDRWRPDVVIIAARWAAEDRQHPDDLLAFLSTRVRQVLLLEQPPELADVGNRSVMQYLAYRGLEPRPGQRQTWPAGNVTAVDRGRRFVRALAARHPRCTVVPLHDVYASRDGALVLDGRNVVYFDDDHLTTQGTELARPLITRALRQVLQPRKAPDDPST